MRRKLVRKVSVLFCGAVLSASSVGAVNFDWAIIGNAGNAADNTGYGAVGYEYSISTTEVTTAQYVEFLNAVAATDKYGLYNTSMGGSTWYSGISRTGSSGSYVYSANAGWENIPVVYVSWYDTLRFVNWLNNGQLSGAQNASTTEDGAYTFSGATSVSARNTGAEYWLPSENEWYKAAYYDPTKNGTGGYWDYATGSDTRPSRTTPEEDTGNSANYYDGSSYLGLTDVGAYDESESPYGTYDQTGNVWEWNDSLYPGCILRGGAWAFNAGGLSSSARYGYYSPTIESDDFGFRVASSFAGDDGGAGDEGGAVPEPASVGLVLLSVGGLVLRRAKKA